MHTNSLETSQYGYVSYKILSVLIVVGVIGSLVVESQIVKNIFYIATVLAFGVIALREIFGWKSDIKTLEERAKVLSREEWANEFAKQYPDKVHLAEQVYDTLVEVYAKDASIFGKLVKYFESKLITKNRRKYFVVSVLGIALIIVSLIFQPVDWNEFIEVAFSNPSTTLNPSRYLLFEINIFLSYIFWLGFGMLMLGLLGAFAYEQTLGKIRNWIDGN